MLGNDAAARRRDDRPRRFRRGVFLLPSLFTVANLFCGYACVVYATRGDFDTAALFIGIAMVLDTLDGFFARLTHSSTRVRRAARLAGRRGVVRARAGDPRVHLGPVAARAARLGRRLHLRDGRGACAWRASTSRPTAVTDKRYFVGLPSPAAGAVIASTVYLFPYGLQDPRTAAPALPWCWCRRCPDGEHDPVPQRQGDRRRLAALVPRAVPRRGGARAHRVAPAGRAGDPVVHLRDLRLRDVRRWAGWARGARPRVPHGPLRRSRSQGSWLSSEETDRKTLD